ncbi:unnamed protein product [Dracunculus medinensis]|uniref:Chitin-binding type-2 domain-containing protein n=1 Tax=Dracunculus medinensis TaxID=318479 RepID=A0A0N4UPS6_DRAME|nr:unnamed protein product [Dracunculus medinensis]
MFIDKRFVKINLSANVNNENNGAEVPEYWRIGLGDICQYPSVHRATDDATRYVECVKIDSDANNRIDLGIWMLKQCPKGYNFFAPIQRCETIELIAKRQILCDGPNASKFIFCPSNNDKKFVVHETQVNPKQCKECENINSSDCQCPTSNIFELVWINRVKKSAHQYTNDMATMICTVCPSTSTKCICPQQSVRQPKPNEEQFIQTPFASVVKNYETTQQSTYQTDQFLIAQPQSCPLVQGNAIQNAIYQGICSWMTDPLALDPESRTHFLQCQPAPNSLFCGRWQRMPCAPGTVFDVNVQICIWGSSMMLGLHKFYV